MTIGSKKLEHVEEVKIKVFLDYTAVPVIYRLGILRSTSQLFPIPLPEHINFI